MKDTNYTLQTSKDNYVTYTTSKNKEDFGMKYIVNNCDNYTNFDENWTCRSTIQNRKGCYCCKDVTDCLLKQIVDECKEQNLKYDTTACSVLQLLEIEEVNE